LRSRTLSQLSGNGIGLVANAILNTAALEATMSTFFDHASHPHETSTVDRFWIANIVWRCWRAYRSRRNQQADFAQLWSMSDYQLRDIGLNRSQLDAAVKGTFAQGPRPRNLP
jgi:uncharacterized protein YjiS (DUF1127 family)